jgi:O-antigen ligase
MQYLSPQSKKVFFGYSRSVTLYLIIASLVFNLMKVNSISIMLLILLWVIEGNFAEKWSLLKKDKLFLGYCLYFSVVLIGMFTAPNIIMGWKKTEIKLGFFVLPMVFCSIGFVDTRLRQNAFTVFNFCTTIALIYCIFVVTRQYAYSQNIELFFYHDLVSPIRHHAIFFSVFVFLNLVFLIYEARYERKWLKILWIMFYLISIILLSSKMVLLVFFVFLIYLMIKGYKKKQRQKPIVILSVLFSILVVMFFLINSPVKNRFGDMFRTNMSILKKEKYNPGDSFSGLQFRLLLWRFTYEILNEKKAWLLGVSPSNAQASLREKYFAMDLYAGDKQKGTHGYFDYNCHNQFLQELLQSGVIGLSVFVFWCITIVQLCIRKKDILLNALVFIMLCFFCTDSVFERQYGMILGTIFPLLLLYSNSNYKKYSKASEVGG